MQRQREDHRASLLELTAFSELAGWPEDDLGAAFFAFRAGARRLLNHSPKTRAFGIVGADLQRLAQHALKMPERLGQIEARRFFETHFRPHRVSTPGFVTAYYEPEVAASVTPEGSFSVPLLRRPADLLDIPEGHKPPSWDSDIRFARRGLGGLEPYFDRAAIEAGALAGQGLELAWLADPVDAYFIHVQGSARLRLVQGGTMRVAFDGKSGHPYTSIGRLAVERGLLAREDAHKEGLETWLKTHPNQARVLMRENRSFIFFRQVELRDSEGPIGAAGVTLTPGRSLAVDRSFVTFHSPVWVDAPEVSAPDGRELPFRRLMIAQDTGSAIVGPARGDLFFGSGDTAGAQAGRVRHPATMIVLFPANAVAP